MPHGPADSSQTDDYLRDVFGVTPEAEKEMEEAAKKRLAEERKAGVKPTKRPEKKEA